MDTSSLLPELLVYVEPEVAFIQHDDGCVVAGGCRDGAADDSGLGMRVRPGKEGVPEQVSAATRASSIEVDDGLGVRRARPAAPSARRGGSRHSVRGGGRDMLGAFARHQGAGGCSRRGACR